MTHAPPPVTITGRYLAVTVAFLGWLCAGVQLGTLPIASLSISQDFMGAAYDAKAAGRWFRHSRRSNRHRGALEAVGCDAPVLHQAAVGVLMGARGAPKWAHVGPQQGILAEGDQTQVHPAGGREGSPRVGVCSTGAGLVPGAGRR